MKKTNKVLFGVLIVAFFTESIFFEANYSFWLTLAVFFMIWVLITKENESI